MLKFLILISAVIFTNAYKVAIVEYHRNSFGTLEENIKANLENFVSIIGKTVSENRNLDLIVFPETSLVYSKLDYSKEEALKVSVFLPDIPDNTTNPCLEPVEKSINYVKELSCASRKYKVYVVANIKSKNTKDEIFNTNIVFDRQGRIVSVYRKIRPFGNERYITQGKKVEYFTTDFGVTFGSFVCFDILFQDTYKEALDKVDAYIHTVNWKSQLPQLVSIEAHQAWSYLHKKVLISSGLNDMTEFAGGSGIYSGRHNVYTSYLSAEPETKVLVAEIRKNGPSIFASNKAVRNLQKFNFASQHPNMNIYKLDEERPSKTISKTLCDGTFCCEFVLKVNSLNGLALAVYNGRNAAKDGILLGTEICAVLQCDDDNCFGMPAKSFFNKKFKKLEVTIKTPTDGADYFPNVALRDMQFLSVDKYSFNDEKLQLKLKDTTKDIYIFGYYGRNYANDVWPNKK